MSLGENLQRLRKEKGLSQEDVAQKLFVSRQSVSKWENGAAEPGVEYLKALANLYGVTLDELMGNEPESPAGSIATEDMHGPESRRQANIRYLWLLVFRVIAAGIIYSISPPSGIIPIDIVAMIVGIWVTAPAMWVVILCLQGLNAVIFMIGISVGDTLSALCLVVFMICIVMMHFVKVRFCKGKE